MFQIRTKEQVKLQLQINSFHALKGYCF